MCKYELLTTKNETKEIVNDYVLKQLKQFMGSFNAGDLLSVSANPNGNPYLIKVVKNAFPLVVRFELIK